MKNKSLIILIFVLVFAATSFASSTKLDRIANFRVSGLINQTHLNVEAIDDPENPFVTIYLTHLTTSLSFSDPSNNSIACRLTSPIPINDGKQIINTKTNMEVINIDKSIGFKDMSVARFYDSKRNVLIYVVYSKKAIDGSLKHSLSVVPLNKF